jgi:hypothetical protein
MVSVVPPAGAPTQILTGAGAELWAKADGEAPTTQSTRIRPTQAHNPAGHDPPPRGAQLARVAAWPAKSDKHMGLRGGEGLAWAKTSQSGASQQPLSPYFDPTDLRLRVVLTAGRQTRPSGCATPSPPPSTSDPFSVHAINLPSPHAARTQTLFDRAGPAPFVPPFAHRRGLVGFATPPCLGPGLPDRGGATAG